MSDETLPPLLRAHCRLGVDGWQLVSEDRAGNPEEKPTNAVALYAKGPRIAWLIVDLDGSYRLSNGRAALDGRLGGGHD